MQTNIPTTSIVLKSLLRADFTTQWRNRRSVILVVLVPVIILITWKPLIPKLGGGITGGAIVLSNCITIGLNAIGLMGYSLSIARDRDKGIFQRLRVAPLSSWSIMISRLLVQLAMIMLVTTATFIIGYSYDGVLLTVPGYILGLYCCTHCWGAVYLRIRSGNCRIGKKFRNG